MSEEEALELIYTNKNFEKLFNYICVELIKDFNNICSTNGKIGMEVGKWREKIMIVCLWDCFGKENVIIVSESKGNIDMYFFGVPMSIKFADITKNVTKINATWSIGKTDEQVEENKKEYKPDFTILYCGIRYGQTCNSIFLIDTKTQNEVFGELGRETYLTRGGKGLTIPAKVVKKLIQHQSTKSIVVTYFPDKITNHNGGLDFVETLYYQKKEKLKLEMSDQKGDNQYTPNLDNNLVETIKIQNRIGRKKCDFKVDLNGVIFYNPYSAKTTYQEVLHSIIDTIGHDELLKNFPNFLASTKDKLSIKRQKDQYEYRGVCYSTHLSNSQKVKNINSIFKKYPFTLSGQATTQEL